MTETVENKPIKVTLEIPFSLPIDLDHPKTTSHDIITVQCCDLDIANLGRGRIKLLKNRDLFQNLANNLLRDPVIAPVQGTAVRYVVEAGRLVPVRESLPISIAAEVQGLTDRQARRLRFALIHQNERFEGDPTFDTLDDYRKRNVFF